MISASTRQITTLTLTAADAPETRIAPANFAPGTTNGLIDAPNAREISDVVSSGDQAEDHDPNGLSAYMYVWGQFIDHDLDHTNVDGVNNINISIPANDPDFPGGQHRNDPVRN